MSPLRFLFLALILSGTAATAFASITIDPSFTCNCVAYGINDTGDIVGTGPTNGSPSFVWNGSSFSSIVYPAGWSFEQPGGINNAGTITGGYFGSGTGHGFIDNGGTFTTFDYPGATSTQVNGVNNSGEFVGGFNSGGGTFLDNGGVLTTPSFPGAPETDAVGIADNGMIVGDYFGIGASPNGFLLSGGVYTSLAFPGATHTVARGVNTNAVVVGYYDDAAGRHGFIYSNGVYTGVDYPGATTETQILGINNLGQFVGDYVNSNGTFGFLASQTPEPSSLGLVAMGAALLVAAAVRSRGLRKKTEEPK